MTCPVVVKVTVPGKPLLVRVAVPGPRGPIADPLAVLETLSIFTENYAIRTGNNGLSVGPVEIQEGTTVTVPFTSTWRVI